MRRESKSVDDPAAAVVRSTVPAIVCTAPDDVAEVKVLAEYRIAVRFHDGTSGVVDLSRLVCSPAAGVFAELRDPAVFARVEVTLGAVKWPGEIDLAPDAMYAALRGAGEWILS